MSVTKPTESFDYSNEPRLISRSHAKNRVVCGILIALLCAANASAEPDGTKSSKHKPAPEGRAVLWRNPADIASRNLFYGEAGADGEAPSDTFTYIKEDLNGTSPKFDVRDDKGTKWTVKLGSEARPETAANRMLWAVGYFTNEDYFLPKIRVKDLQPVSKKRRKRAEGLIDPDGTMYNVELKRHPDDEEKIGSWKWRSNPFTGTRELNGLRVMMAVLNNWDLKDENNSIYVEKESKKNKSTEAADEPEAIYLVSDVGATFGTSGRVRNSTIAKGNLNSYERSKFIRKLTGNYVDFYVPSRESWVLIVDPKEYVERLRLRWIGRHIPRADARWMGQLLANLSQDQIRDAFRAAGYTQVDVDAFTRIIEDRITALNDL